MQVENLERIADILNNSDKYRVIKKYQKPEFYNLDCGSSKLIGVFLDIESTGLSTEDKLIELGMVKFEYSEDGRIFRILEEFNGYQDPNQQISEFITGLTGITNDIVRGQQIEETAVAKYLDNVDIIIAHNAAFDRAFFERTFPSVSSKPWACSMYDIEWNNEKIEGFKLEYIAYKYNFFYEGHRAVIDCLAGIHILAQGLFNSKGLVLKQLLDNGLQPRYKLWTKNASYDHKDCLRGRRYKWDTHPIHNFKAWAIELPENKVEAEINYLKSNIYNGSMNIPVDIFDAHSRFSINNTFVQNNLKYSEKLRWIKALQHSITD